MVSEAQTRGRGRRGRSWHAEPGRNLLFSLVLRPGLPDRRRSMVTVAAAVAVAETCAEVVGPPAVEVKWPNDVLVGGRKCCGMLLESAGEAIVLGVGCNVNQLDFPTDLADRATSVRLEAGRLIERAPFLVQLLDRIRTRYDELGDGESDRLIARYEARMRHREEPVRCRIEDQERWIEAVPLGLTATGELRVELDGTVRTLRAGDVTFRPRRTRPSTDS